MSARLERERAINRKSIGMQDGGIGIGESRMQTTLPEKERRRRRTMTDCRCWDKRRSEID